MAESDEKEALLALLKGGLRATEADRCNVWNEARTELMRVVELAAESGVETTFRAIWAAVKHLKPSYGLSYSTTSRCMREHNHPGLQQAVAKVKLPLRRSQPDA